MDRWRLLGWEHSLIAATPLPTNESPPLSIGAIVISGLDSDLTGYWFCSSVVAGNRDEGADKRLDHLPFATTPLEPKDQALDGNSL